MDETEDAVVETIGRHTAPWGRELVVQSVTYASGLRLARLRIRKGRRFTIVDLDAAAIGWLNDTLRGTV